MFKFTVHKNSSYSIEISCKSFKCMERFQNFVPIGGAQSHYFVFIDQQRSIRILFVS
jgi:hypothetical protein